MTAQDTPLGTLRALAAEARSDTGRVALDYDGDIAWIRLDSPTVHNALSVRMMVELAEAVQALAAFDGRAVILASATPGLFCSGGHLDEVQRALLDPESGRRMASAMGPVLDALLDLPLVSVAAIDGPAIGGGAELATACDFRVVRRGARIQFVQARLGVAAGWGGAGRLVRHVGRRAALRLLAEAGPVDADEALRIGLADGITDGRADEGALALLERTRRNPAAAVRAVKAQIVAPHEAPDRFAEVWGGPDHVAALDRMRR